MREASGHPGLSRHDGANCIRRQFCVGRRMRHTDATVLAIELAPGSAHGSMPDQANRPLPARGHVRQAAGKPLQDAVIAPWWPECRRHRGQRAEGWPNTDSGCTPKVSRLPTRGIRTAHTMPPRIYKDLILQPVLSV